MKSKSIERVTIYSALVSISQKTGKNKGSGIDSQSL
jgi:hypothetical protein